MSNKKVAYAFCYAAKACSKSNSLHGKDTKKNENIIPFINIFLS